MAIDLVKSWFGKVLHQIAEKYNPQKGVWRIPSIAYTLEHKLAYMEREHYLTGRYSFKGILHDWDKLFLYLVPLSDFKLQKIHISHQPHHMESPKQTKVEHIIESCIDIDCSPLTKKDKPYLMFDVMMHVYPNQLEYIVPVILAVTPESVTPRISEMDAERQAKFPTYLFKTAENEKNMYQRITQVLHDIITGLPDETTIVNAKPEHYPVYLKEMTSVQIFLKTVAILAQARREKPDILAMRRTLMRIQAQFDVAGGFIRQTKIPELEHDALQKMKHPFFVPKAISCRENNRQLLQARQQSERMDNQHT